MKKIILLILLPFLISCQKKSIPVVHQDLDLNILIIGDWGKNGSFKQKTVAKSMDLFASKYSLDSIVTTGDNFYPSGVSSIDDAKWKTNFENIYSLENIKSIPWYISSGNHDQQGSIKAQIDYSKINSKWNFPKLYYKKRFVKNNIKSDLFFIATTPCLKSYYKQPRYKNLLKLKFDCKKQYQWLDQSLKKSDADWKLVIAHHHILSGSNFYGDLEILKKDLKPLLEKRKVDFYISGHEHDLQLLKDKSKTHYIVSGAGSSPRETRKGENNIFASSELGFAVLSLGADTSNLSFIGEKSKILFNYSINKN